MPNTFAPSPTPAPISSGLNDLFELSTSMAINTGGYVAPKAVSATDREHLLTNQNAEQCNSCFWMTLNWLFLFLIINHLTEPITTLSAHRPLLIGCRHLNISDVMKLDVMIGWLSPSIMMFPYNHTPKIGFVHAPSVCAPNEAYSFLNQPIRSSVSMCSPRHVGVVPSARTRL